MANQKNPLEAFKENIHMLQLDEEANGALLGYAQRNLDRMAVLAGAAYQGEIPEFPICRLMPLGRLAVLVWKLGEIKARYQEMGVDEGVVRETLADIALRQRLYFEKTAKVGVAKGDCIWFRHLVNRQIFKLGVLQFQPFEMLYLEEKGDGTTWFSFSEAQKKRLPAGSPVLNVHIQKGADLDLDKVVRSFELAKSFFEKHMPETKFEAFVCYSWLLHPGLGQLLEKESRIVRFAEQFELIGQVCDREQALERIFGKRYRARKDAPQETRLQKAALRDLSKLGYACGVKWW